MEKGHNGKKEVSLRCPLYQAGRDEGKSTKQNKGQNWWSPGAQKGGGKKKLEGLEEGHEWGVVGRGTTSSLEGSGDG